MREAASTGRPDRVLLVILGAFVFVTVYSVNLFPRFRNPNEFSRYELVVSMAERGTFSIDRELAALGDHEDKAVSGGRSFSNKAPGLSFAALPFYFLFRPFLGPANRDNSTAMIYLLRLTTVSSATVLALFLLARRLRRLCADARFPALALFAIAFGTPLLVYGRSFFSHAWTAALLYLSFELLEAKGARSSGHAALAGLLAGWAVLSEYPVAVVVAVLFLAELLRNPKRGLLFAAGGLPAAALLGFYDWRCFGGIFEVSSRHEAFHAYTQLSRERFIGFRLPSAAIAARYLFSESRGILFASPCFFFLPAAAMSPKIRCRAAAVSLAAATLYFAVMCGYENWHGGWALGSRYLLPVVLLAGWPLAGVGNPDAGGAARLARLVFAAGASFSAAYFLFAGSTFWAVPHVPASGIRFYSAFWISRGWMVPTLLGDSVSAHWPELAATIVAAAAAFAGQFPSRLRAATALLSGVLVFALLFAGQPLRGTFGDRLARAMILDGSSDADPSRDELRKLAPEARTPGERQAFEHAVARYGAGP